MSTLKDVLCLLAIFVAFGIAGRLDYEDAVMLEEAQQAPVPVDCPPASTQVISSPVTQTNDLPVDPRPPAPGTGLPKSDTRCAPRVL